MSKRPDEIKPEWNDSFIFNLGRWQEEYLHFLTKSGQVCCAAITGILTIDMPEEPPIDPKKETRQAIRELERQYPELNDVCVKTGFRRKR